MKKVSALMLILVFSLCLCSQSVFSQAKYTGVKMCSACHKGAKNHNVFEKWQSSDHSKAFETLKSDKSKEIAKKMNIADPTTSDKCLVCHVTNGNIGAGIKKEEGVTCESCHGAGSDYKAMDVMKNHDLAVKKGMILGKGDAGLCKRCHNPKSPTYKPFEFGKKWALIAHPSK